MTKIGKATIFKHGVAKTLYFSVPSSVAQDSAFPFKVGDKVIVEVKGDKLEVRKDGSGHGGIIGGPPVRITVKKVENHGTLKV